MVASRKIDDTPRFVMPASSNVCRPAAIEVDTKALPVDRATRDAGDAGAFAKRDTYIGEGVAEKARSARKDDEQTIRAKALAAGMSPKPKRLLVLMWDPHRKDQGTRLTPDEVDKAMFGKQSSSLREYYKDQSGGKAVIDKVAVLGWYDADKPADHYWNHPADAKDGYDSGHVEKWAEVLKKADKKVDFASFDDNGDKQITPDELGILIVIPQAQPFGTNRTPQGPNKTPLTLDGVKIGQIAEVYLPSPANHGVVRHEVGHLFFGMPDLYGNNRHKGQGAGPYSIMDVTYTDAQVDAVQRVKLGWVKATDISSTGKYALGSVEKTREALRFERPGANPKEYFLIEKRERGKYDKDLKDPGLVIWRVTEDGPEGQQRLHPCGKDAWPLDQNMKPLALKWTDGTDAGLTIAYDKKHPDRIEATVTKKP